MTAKRVLIVEDDYLIAEGLSRAIEDDGFSVIGPVGTAAGALRVLRREQPDAALLDVRLRQGDSLEVARALRQRGVPFAVVSGYTRESLPPEMAAVPFLAKPLGELELVEVARTLLTEPLPL
ncbi:MAG: response regulator [Proteobacteria bacterium]|nr:response regulator [Pseudomonadota bacterium]